MQPVTLDNCATEPIHIPGSVQPHGVLFACRGNSLEVRHVSASVVQHLAREPGQCLGTSLFEIFDDPSRHRLAAAVRSGDRLREVNPLRVCASDGKCFDAVLHRADPDLVIVELEPSSDAETEPGFHPRLRASLHRLQGARDVRSLCAIAAEQVREITGFDRVMVYRFDREWNGEVVAESKLEALEPFLGLHYPASDIPAQARRLYTVNWLRFIADVDYRPSLLVPPCDPDSGAPLDLSHSVLRSVSPIHIEYLHNMGVTASMSVSLIVDGTLTGLIACHHYSGPKVVSFRTRDTAEYMGQALSWNLRVLETSEQAERIRTAYAYEGSIVQSIVNSRELLDGLAIESLLQLTDAASAVVLLSEGVRKLGNTPRTELVADIVRFLKSQSQDVFATEQLSEFVPAAAAEVDVAAGLLALAISRELGEYILWFRPSTERTVDWAGDPNKVIESRGDGAPPRLSPRGSFALWRETVYGRALPWETWQVQAASNLRRVLLGGVRLRAVELRTANERLVEADRSKDAFIATVGHELRTPLNAIVGWAELLKTGRMAEDRYAHALGIITRNAQAQSQIIDDLLDISRMTSGKLSIDVQTVDLVALVEGVLESVMLATTAKDLRVKRMLDSSASPVLGDAARLRQIVSNLLTNAIKFTPKGGSLTVVLRRQLSDVEFAVTDSGQGIAPEFLPFVFDAFRQQDMAASRRSGGLGLGLAIVRHLVELHGGRVEAQSDGLGKGSTFRVRLPMSPTYREAERQGEPPQPQRRELLRELRLLVVEDEPDAREMLHYVLADEGAVVHPAGDVAEALGLIAAHTFDAIISDIGLPGRDGLELARTVRSSGNPVPMVALTAYTRAVDRMTALQAGFNAHVPKPVEPDELVTVLASLLGRLGGA